MCLDVLLDGDAHERPPTELLRAELPAALRTGLLAAAFVAVVSALDATPPVTVAALVVLAVGLGVCLQLGVLLLGVGARRGYDRLRPALVSAAGPR